MLEEILRFQVEQTVTSLFKRFLNIVEDLREEHRSHFEKLRTALPSQYHALLSQADYFDDDRYAYYRKRILDIGNEARRIVNAEFAKIENLLNNTR